MIAVEPQTKVSLSSAAPRRAIDPAFAAMLVLGLAARIAYAIPRHICFGDESCYLYLAQNLFGGKGFTYYNNIPELHFPPFFPVVLGVLNLAVRDWEIVSRVAYVIFGTLIIVPIYFLARAMYGQSTARFAAFLTALLPAWTSGVLFAETMSEPLYLFCLVSGIACLHGALQGGKWPVFAGAGAFFALAYLTRPEGMLYFFLALAILPAAFLVHRRLAVRQAAIRLGVLAAAFLLVAFPYLVYVRKHVGAWTLSTKGTTTYTTTRGLVEHNGKVDGATFLRDTWGLNEDGEVHYFSHDYGEGLLPLLLGKYRDRVLPDLCANLYSCWKTLRQYSYFGQHLLYAAVAGLAISLIWRRNLAAEVFQVILLAPLGAFLLFFIKERYLYPLLLPLVLWMAVALEAVIAWLGAGRFPGFLPGFLGRAGARRALQAAVLLVATGYLVGVGYQVYAKDEKEMPDIWECEEAIGRLTPPDAVIMAAYPQVAFHAGRRWLPVPVAPLEDVVAYGRKRGATHLVFASWHTRVRPREQGELIWRAASRPGLELIVSNGAASGKPFAIYRLTGE